MKKLSTIYLLLLIMTGIIKPQNADDYFPYAVGNTWQYRTMEGDLKTTTITKDSVDNDGNVFLNYNNQTGIFEWIYKITKDKDSVFIFPAQHNDLEYVFPLEKGKEWIIESYGEDRSVGYVYDTYKVVVFGDSVDTYSVAYLVTTEDTITWPGNYQPQPVRIMAKGFGVIEEYEETTFKKLVGAVINGKTYGKIVSVETENNSLPSRIKLYQNYPNPFNPETAISFQLSSLSFVILKVFDVLGSEVATLVNEEKPQGNYTVSFNANKLSSGIYFYTIRAGKFHRTKKMVLLR